MSWKIPLLLFSCVFCASAEARAQTITDGRVWFGASFVDAGSPGSPWRWTVESLVRSREGIDEVDVAALRPTVMYAVNAHSSIGGGYALALSFPVSGGTTIEQRVFVQYIWSGRAAGGALTLRTRAESRFIEGNSAPLGRLRQQIRFTRALRPGSRWSLVLADELMFHTNDTTRSASGVDQNRASAGVSVAATASMRVEVGYMNQFSPGHRGAPDRMNHILSSALSISF